MHRLLFLFLNLLLIQSYSLAQNFTVDPNPAYAEADLDDPSTFPDFMQAFAVINNNTSDTLYLKWDRVLEDTPDGWGTGVCDPNICLLHHVSSGEFVLYPNQTNQQLLVEAYPGMEPGGIPIYGAVPGEGTVKLKVTNLNDLSDTLIATYNFILSGDPILSTSEAELKQIKLYPNPASNSFKLTGNKGVEKIVVYDAFGRQVESFIVNGDQDYDISQLSKGIYLAHLLGKKDETLKTLRFQKN